MFENCYLSNNETPMSLFNPLLHFASIDLTDESVLSQACAVDTNAQQEIYENEFETKQHHTGAGEDMVDNILNNC